MIAMMAAMSSTRSLPVRRGSYLRLPHTSGGHVGPPLQLVSQREPKHRTLDAGRFCLIFVGGCSTWRGRLQDPRCGSLGHSC